MRAFWLSVVVCAGLGCSDPFPPLENVTAPLDDTSPDDTSLPPYVPPVDTSPPEDTGDGPTITEPPPRPNDVTFSIDLERIELLTRGCEDSLNGPAVEVYYELQVGDVNGFPLFLRTEPSSSVKLFPVGHPDAAPLELESDPVELHLNEDGTDSLFLIGQIWDDDTASRDLIGTFDVTWSDPAEVDVGTLTFTDEGPTENEPDDRCSVSLVVTIAQIDPKPE